MKHPPVLHPILFAAYPVLAIIANNATHNLFPLAIRALIVVPAGSVILLLAMRLVVKDWYRAGVLTSIGVILFLYYGHVYRLSKNLPLGLPLAVHHLILFSLWALLLGLLGSGRVWKRVRPPLITNILNLISIVVLVFPLTIIAMIPVMISRDPLGSWKPVNTGPAALEPAAGYLPDIYYIIADGYARADVLEEMYQFDNSEFVEFLKSRGFYVGERSRANYVQTYLSLASSLNMRYLDDLGAAGTDSWNRAPLMEMIGHSRARALLTQAGYRTISFASGFMYTEIQDADVYVHPYLVNLNDFEQLLVATSAVEILVDWKVLNLPTFRYDTHRARVLYAYDQLADLPSIGGPKFVFAHIVSPHPPFVLDRDGNPLTPPWPYFIGDGTHFQGTAEDYKRGYIDQLAYANKRLEQIIDAILAKSKTPPIIILQADHGPGSRLDWDSAARTCHRERASILNAYYLPNAGAAQLYDSISPVNSFRVVFNACFGAGLGLLDDKSYYSTMNHPYDFIDVSEQDGNCAAAPGQ